MPEDLGFGMRWLMSLLAGRTHWTAASISEAGRTRKTVHCGWPSRRSAQVSSQLLVVLTNYW